MNMTRNLLSLTALLGALIFALPATAADEAAARNMIHILDYISVDYPAVIDHGRITNPEEYAEQQEFAERLQGLSQQLPAAADKATLQSKVQALVEAIDHQAAGEQISHQAKDLAQQLILTYNIHLAPALLPSLQEGKALFEANCSACHGMTGHGDGPRAAALKPQPANFHDLARQSQRSLYSLYSTISLGMVGTAMPSFDGLSQNQRWSLAFYVSQFSSSETERQQGHRLWEHNEYRQRFPDLASVTGVSPAQVAQEHGAPARAVLAYLRSNPAALGVAEGTATSPYLVTVQKLQQSLEHYGNGRRKAAYDAAVAAYLEGFEPVEKTLSLMDPELRLSIEDKMGHYRKALQQGEPMEKVRSREQELESLLHTAMQRMQGETLSPMMGAFSAFILLLREGLEAILVLAAIIAFLNKAERRDALPYVHAGWIGALFLGVLTWVGASFVFDLGGANRELTEGSTALVAAAMLVYMGYWLHSNASAQRWKEFIHDKLHGALHGNPVWAMVTISFIAVYREVFETILFYQTLWLQMRVGDRGYLLLGLAAAVGFLLALAWAILRFSMRLPLKQFFTANAVLLYGLAVVFAGKGVTALQEAGVLSINPVHFPRFEWLGIYPSLESLSAQALLLGLAGAWLLYGRYQLRHRAPLT